jgi:periplasmic protein TonB
MAPLTKDSVEAANSGAVAAVTPAGDVAKQASAGGGHLRADALSLEVPVKVHGSRVTDVARGVAPHTEPFEEETSTMIVFPQGAVLRMSTAVNASQMLVVTNLKTRQDAICRVLKVRTFTNMQGYVEVEFTHKQPGYWGANFPSEGGTPATEAAPTISAGAPSVATENSVVTAPAKAAPVSPNAPVAPVAASAPPSVKPAAPAPVIPAAPGFVAPSKPEPAFAQIGTQEEVQPAASATTPAPAAVKFVAPVRPAAPVHVPAHTPTPAPPPAVVVPLQQEHAPEPSASETPQNSIAAQALADAKIEFAAEPVAPPPSLSLSELRGDDAAASGALATESPATASEEKDEGSVPAISLSGSTHGTFGSFSGGAALGGSRAASTELFGARFDGSEEISAGEISRPRGNNWLLIAACSALLVAGASGGVYYLRTHSANTAAPKLNTPAVPQTLAFQSPLPSATTNEARPSNAETRNSASHPVPTVTQANAPAVTVSAPASSSNSRPAAVERKTPKITADMVQQQLDEHPVAQQRSDAAATDAAPAPDFTPGSGTSNASALSGIVSSNVAQPEAPEIRPEGNGPVKVGGNVKEPRLVTHVMPEYPLVAKEAGIQGDVAIRTTIDVKGNVVNAQVISGPQMLRGAALAALRRWKYEPSTLNGQPIAVQMLVTIKFSR